MTIITPVEEAKAQRRACLNAQLGAATISSRTVSQAARVSGTDHCHGSEDALVVSVIGFGLRPAHVVSTRGLARG